MIHTVTLVTHPNRLGAAEPLGYRFAVHLTSREDDGAPVVVDPADLATVINAGWRPDIDKALLDGADQQMTAAGALTLAGLTAELATLTASTDYHPPTPPEQ